jgi:hypothetical protein
LCWLQGPDDHVGGRGVVPQHVAQAHRRQEDHGDRRLHRILPARHHVHHNQGRHSRLLHLLHGRGADLDVVGDVLDTEKNRAGEEELERTEEEIGIEPAMNRTRFSFSDKIVLSLLHVGTPASGQLLL